MEATMIKHVSLTCSCGQPLHGWRHHEATGVWLIGEMDTEITAQTAWAASVTDMAAWGAATGPASTTHDVQDSTGWVLSFGTCGQ